MISDSIKFLHAQFSNVLLVLIIIIALLGFILLMRRFRSEQYAARKGAVDSGASEGALKALLQEIQNMPPTTSPAKPVKLEQLSEKDRSRLEREVQQKMAAAGDPKSQEGAEVLQQLREKDNDLNRLQAKIKELQTRLDNVPEGSPAAGETLAEIESLQGKIQDLEARLKEYEIIEDDIADLSNYKEENARLREMLEAQGVDPSQVKAQGEAESQEDSAGEVATEQAEAKIDAGAAQQEPAEEAAAEEAAPVVAGNDSAETMEDAAPEPAVQVDADQLLSEVDELLTLAENPTDESSALDEDLNTDQLLKEAQNMPGDQAGE